MQDTPRRDPWSHLHQASRNTLSRLFLWIFFVLSTLSCTAPGPTETKASTVELDRFWSQTDDTIHDVQQSLRSARQIARQLGGGPEKGDYEAVIALGHRIGGLGHDHVTPSENPPVLAMLDTMNASIEALTRTASVSADLDAAKAATNESISKLSPTAQRLYHLLSAQEKVAGIRARAVALGFHATP